jgi:hypothetical protein
VDFNLLKGKTIAWTGAFEDEGGYTHTYVLTQDGVGIVIPDPSSDEKMSILDDAHAVLQELVEDNIEFANSVLSLKAILEAKPHGS